MHEERSYQAVFSRSGENSEEGSYEHAEGTELLLTRVTARRKWQHGLTWDANLSLSATSPWYTRLKREVCQHEEEETV